MPTHCCNPPMGKGARGNDVAAGSCRRFLEHPCCIHMQCGSLHPPCCLQGMTPALLGGTSGWGLYFGCYKYLKAMLPEDLVMRNFIAATSAGLRCISHLQFALHWGNSCIFASSTFS